MTQQRGTPSRQAVCLSHITDPHLLRTVRTGPARLTCCVCAAGPQRSPVTVALEALVEQVSRAVGHVYRKVAHTEPRGGRRLVQGTVTSADVVNSMCVDALDEGARAVVARALEPARWAPHGLGEPDDHGEVHASWPGFAEQARHRRRFTLLSTGSGAHDRRPGGVRSTLELLDGVCAAVESLGLVRTLPAGHRIWRGRMRRDMDSPGYDAASIGAAPPCRTTGNRLSSAGISMFYGSATPDVAVAEISAHDPRPFAAVAVFELTRPVSVIDLTAIPTPPSLFDPHGSRLFFPIEFIRAFAQDLSRPVALDGREHLDYVPTQIVTEYFRWMAPLAVDGMLYLSARDTGVNYGLFTGPEGCVDTDEERPGAMLRLVPGSEVVVKRWTPPPGADAPSGERLGTTRN
jgi:hypothetical protein